MVGSVITKCLRGDSLPRVLMDERVCERVRAIPSRDLFEAYMDLLTYRRRMVWAGTAVFLLLVIAFTAKAAGFALLWKSAMGLAVFPLMIFGLNASRRTAPAFVKAVSALRRFEAGLLDLVHEIGRTNLTYPSRASSRGEIVRALRARLVELASEVLRDEARFYADPTNGSTYIIRADGVRRMVKELYDLMKEYKLLGHGVDGYSEFYAEAAAQLKTEGEQAALAATYHPT